MCRIIVASGNIDIQKIMDSITLMARDQNSVHELNQKQGPGSWLHSDGWGIAYLEKGKFKMIKSPQNISGDPKATLPKIKTNLLIAHVRRKAGSEVALENTHPFKAKHAQLGECVFCHNGCIEDEIPFNTVYKLQGKTDSEKLFYAIVSQIQEKNEAHITVAIRNQLKKYTKTKGSNVVLSTKEKTFVAMRKNDYPQYYGLRLGKGNDFILISSEKLKTFPYIYWESLQPGDVVTVNNGTIQYSVSREKVPLLQKITALIK
jgi:predicted glutamine amidotransferase